MLAFRAFEHPGRILPLVRDAAACWLLLVIGGTSIAFPSDGMGESYLGFLNEDVACTPLGGDDPLGLRSLAVCSSTILVAFGCRPDFLLDNARRNSVSLFVGCLAEGRS